MADFILRSVKNAPLTNDEVDGTFQHLKDAVDLLNTKTFTNSAQLANLLNDETGSGKAVFATSPVFVNGVYTSSLTFALYDTVATTINFAGACTTLNIGAVGMATTLQGTLSVIGDVIAFASSDARLKENVEEIPNALEIVKAIRGVTWDWKEEVREDVKQSPTTGLIAQEVEAVFPLVVRTDDDEDGTKRINYEHMIGLLVQAIKELNDKVDSCSCSTKE